MVMCPFNVQLQWAMGNDWLEEWKASPLRPLTEDRSQLFQNLNPPHIHTSITGQFGFLHSQFLHLSICYIMLRCESFSHLWGCNLSTVPRSNLQSRTMWKSKKPISVCIRAQWFPHFVASSLTHWGNQMKVLIHSNNKAKLNVWGVG